MKPLDLCASPRPACRLLAIACAAAAAFALTGCAGPKDQYAASADAQQRMAAEAAADTKAGAAVDTQPTYLKLVEQMQKEDLWFASLAHIDALEQRWGVSPESTRTRAEALRHTGQAAAAEAAYKRLLATPLASAGYRGLGLLAGMRGNYAEAVQLLAQAQRRTPTDALLLSDLGYAHLGAGQIEEARLPLMQALQLRPDSTQAQANLALYLEVTNQPDRAAALMDAHRMPQPTRAGRARSGTADARIGQAARTRCCCRSGEHSRRTRCGAPCAQAVPMDRRGRHENREPDQPFGLRT